MRKNVKIPAFYIQDTHTGYTFSIGKPLFNVSLANIVQTI